MTQAEAAFWERAHRVVANLTPDLIAAVLNAFQIIRDSLTVAELARLVKGGSLETMMEKAFSDAMLDRSLIPVQQKLRAATQRSFNYFVRQSLPSGGKINGQVAVAFDYLNPKVIDAIRTLETRVMTTLKSDVRDVVRAYVENGLRDGVNPVEIARELRDIIGLAPNQLTAINNFELALRGEGRNPLAYKLRDRRFDKTIKKGGLSETQITRMTDAYRKRMLAHNAETNARTASLDAMKLGQRLAWQKAIDSGVVDGGSLYRRWVGVMDDRERPSHVAMQGDTVPFDAPHSNGQMIPGDDEWNCRCLDHYFVRAA